MRTMLRVTIPCESGNRAVKEGTLGKTLEWAFGYLKPEAAYFTADNGKRTALFVFDLKDQSQIPAIAEPFFMNLGAEIQFQPTMNIEDLKAGLDAAAKNM